MLPSDLDSRVVHAYAGIVPKLYVLLPLHVFGRRRRRNRDRGTVACVDSPILKVTITSDSAKAVRPVVIVHV